MADGMKVVDAAAREAALDINDSFIVQAPAGSGKTGLLTQRFLALLANAGEPEEILAITFTHKAAGEMRSRIFSALQTAVDDLPPEKAHERLTWELARAVLAQDKKNGWSLLHNPGRLRVQTIDSLCASLTRQMPLLSTFGSQPAVADDAGFLYAEAARKTLADIEAGESWSAHVEHLLRHLDNNLYRVEQLLAEMLQRRDHWLRHIADNRDERIQRKSLEAILQRIIEEHLQLLHDSVPAEVAGELVSLAAIAADKLQQLEIDSPIHACLKLKHLPGHNIAHLVQWQGIAHLLLTGENWRKPKGINRNLGFPPEDKKNPEAGDHAENKRRMQDLLDKLVAHEKFRESLAGLQSLPAANYSETQWDILQALIELLPVAVAHLRLVFRAHGMVDFTEISQKAVLALGSDELPTDLALALDYRIHHLLVDEFQDTSLSQYRLLERLTAGWEEQEGRTLFLVGDPMQSIYRFREAEVALYLRARHRGIGPVSLTPLTLSVNFRSNASLIDWFNAAFSRVFPDREDLTTGAVTYEPSNASGTSDNDCTVEVYPALRDDRAHEAQRVLELVRRLKDQDPQQTIAVLVRARSHLDHLVGALNEAGIGFRAVEIEHLSHRQPVIDLVSLTRALLHPADRVAWIAILRAPWLGLTLKQTGQLLGDDRELPVWQCLQDTSRWPQLPDPLAERLRTFVEVINGAIDRRQQLVLDQWVEDTWLALGGPATLEATRDLSDCEQYFRLLRKMTADGNPITVGSLHKELDKLYASTDPSADEGLQLMTIHKAKGLEFDAVILPGLGRKSPSANTRLLNWVERATEYDDSELLIAPISASGEERDSINTYLRYLDKQREHNESVRLLYVAATRARRSLHLFGHTSVSNDELQTPMSGSLLATLWPAVVDEFERAFSQSKDLPVGGEASMQPGYGDVQGIRRLAPHWTMPVSLRASENGPVRDEEPVEYSWVGPSARHIGTAVHRSLEYLVRHGHAAWDGADRSRLRANTRNELLTLGVPAADVDRAVDTVIEAVTNTLADERGRWLLDNTYEGSRCEYALVSLGDDGPVTSIIDRTFIDRNGVRWIVDYKTSTHSGGGLDEFLDRERERYQPQLERYARVIQQLEDRPVRLGLYFPLLGGWREWDYSR